MTLDAPGREQLSEDLRRFAAPAIDPEVRTDFCVQEGVAASRILDEVKTGSVDLVVMGTHGRGGFDRLVLGSVAEKVLRKATCPVLTVPPPAPGLPRGPLVFKEIVCPVDFSPASQRALQFALSLAEESDSRLTLVHVVEALSEEVSIALAPYNLHEYRRQIDEDARHQLQAAVPEQAREWCTVEEVLACGKPYREILRIANERQAQLIVMGVQGRNALDLMLFGSTTNHVVRQAACPVLTLRGV
jgi:nucleotide-binding universal stress UspA family protein